MTKTSQSHHSPITIHPKYHQHLLDQALLANCTINIHQSLFKQSTTHWPHHTIVPPPGLAIHQPLFIKVLPPGPLTNPYTRKVSPIGHTIHFISNY